MDDYITKTEFFGFIMNIKAVLRDMLQRNPDLQAVLKTETPARWMWKIMPAAGIIYGEESQVGQLEIGSVWIGNGESGLCWVLPIEFIDARHNLNELQESRLKELQRILETDNSPRYFYRSDEPEPAALKEAHIHEEFYNASSYKRIAASFAEGKREETIKQLLEDFDNFNKIQDTE